MEIGNVYIASSQTRSELVRFYFESRNDRGEEGSKSLEA